MSMPMFQHRLSELNPAPLKSLVLRLIKENRSPALHMQSTELINTSVLNGLLAVNRFTGTEIHFFSGDI